MITQSKKLFENRSKTDINFNYDHYSPEIAQLEKWNDLAQKFFRMHEADLRPKFYEKWAGTNGRFQREIRKLEQNYERPCGQKNWPNLIPKQSTNRPVRSANFQNDNVGEISLGSRERRSGGKLKVAHNPGHRMRHIVRNVHKWTEEYLNSCKNQHKVVNRWLRFNDRWEKEIAKNPIFQEEFEAEKRYLRNNDGPGKPCGRIYREFGLHGQYMELRDASVDQSNGIHDLGETAFGNDEMMSMVPFKGKSVLYICIILYIC